MTDEPISIPKETAQILFDALVHSMDFGSGFLDSDEVNALRELALALGVDPQTATPEEFRAPYPHVYDGETDRTRVAWMLGDLKQTVAYDQAFGVPRTVNVIDESVVRDFAPCKVGTYSHWCLKPADDPIHLPGT